MMMKKGVANHSKGLKIFMVFMSTAANEEANFASLRSQTRCDICGFRQLRHLPQLAM